MQSPCAVDEACAYRAVLLSAPVAVSDSDGVGVHHRGLNARPWAHVDAYLFAHEAAENKGCRGQDRDGDIGHWMRLKPHQITQQRGRVGEIEHPGATGGNCDQQPDRPFGQPQPPLVKIPLGMVQAHTRVAVAFDPAFDQI